MPVLNCDDALLEKALGELRVAWEATAETWRDQARADFGADHFEPLEARVRQAAGAIRRMDTLLREAVRQCT
jgi:hypothetical protein